MNVARVVVLIVALVAGGAAAFLAMNVINQEPTAPATAQAVVPAPPAIETDEILVAVEDIPLGTAIDTDTVAWRAWPRDAIAGTYILRSQLANGIDDIAGTRARSEFFASEPITQAKLARTEGGLLSAILPAGMRAIALQINADTSAGGFILPNDRVDIIMTR